MMGLMFHGKAKRLVKNKKYDDALEVLTMGEVCYLVFDFFMHISFPLCCMHSLCPNKKDRIFPKANIQIWGRRKYVSFFFE